MGNKLFQHNVLQFNEIEWFVDMHKMIITREVHVHQHDFGILWQRKKNDSYYKFTKWKCL